MPIGVRIAPSNAVMAIDPGNEETAWVVYDVTNKKPLSFGKSLNDIVLSRIRTFSGPLAIEMIASYGMAVGKTVFETCVWIGRFIEARNRTSTYDLIYRRDVKLHVCGVVRANDSNVRSALIDRFGPPGTKKSPGLTYGITKDIWAALSVAVTWAETRK